jgi:hypothetical protein
MHMHPPRGTGGWGMGAGFTCIATELRYSLPETLVALHNHVTRNDIPKLHTISKHPQASYTRYAH